MITTLINASLLVVLVMALISPLESLRWWAHRYPTLTLPTPTPTPRPGVRRFAVYLSGIGVLDGDANARGEQAALKAVRHRLPEVVITEDVFPYAMENRGLSQRGLSWLWKHLDWVRRRIPWSPMPLLINLRNVMQVLVSADPRYGDTYNFGMACVIWHSLLRAGFDPDSPRPVTLIGYSGGAQISCGVARYLAAHGVKVSVISIGGVFGDGPGLDSVDSLVHLSGSKDRVQRLGSIIFPGRWPSAPLSAYARAVRDGRIHTVDLGPVRHDGRGWYFSRTTRLPDGRTHLDATVDELVKALT